MALPQTGEILGPEQNEVTVAQDSEPERNAAAVTAVVRGRPAVLPGKLTLP
jgi:hypothetical protein